MEEGSRERVGGGRLSCAQPETKPVAGPLAPVGKAQGGDGAHTGGANQPSTDPLRRRIADGYEMACKVALEELDRIATSFDFGTGSKQDLEPLVKTCMTTLSSKMCAGVLVSQGVCARVCWGKGKGGDWGPSGPGGPAG